MTLTAAARQLIMTVTAAARQLIMTVTAAARQLIMTVTAAARQLMMVALLEQRRPRRSSPSQMSTAEAPHPAPFPDASATIPLRV